MDQRTPPRPTGRRRRLIIALGVLLALAFGGAVIADSMDGSGGGAHAMPDGSTMQDGAMPPAGR